MDSIEKFIGDQLSLWPLASANFRALKSVETKSLNVGGLEIKVQHNTARIISTTANIDPEVLAARPCFLCSENIPQEQMRIPFEGRKGRKYALQVNPYPIFPGHLVVPAIEHTPQSIWHRFVDFLDLSEAYGDYTFFYNGPVSGASAPDHMHFQACPTGSLPLLNAVEAAFNGDPDKLEYLSSVQDASIYRFKGFINGVFAMKAKTSKSQAKLFYRFLDCLETLENETEPRFNLYTWRSASEFRTVIVLRAELRPHHFFSTGGDHLTISPGAADIAGFLVAPVPGDLQKITDSLAEELYKEVTVSKDREENVIWRLTRSQRTVDVGIMSASEICFEIISDGAGRQKVSFNKGRIDYGGALYDELCFDAVTPSTLFAEPSFILYDVPIGIEFHWQRLMDQKFAGRLKFIVEGDKITAVNTVGIEDYLLSVISSEMKSTSSLEFLKAHAIISRSWLLCNLRSHACFDVCADDHCQRYQGLSHAVGETVRQAVDQTWGKVLKYGGEICDTRFSKCCGGITEKFSTCWEDKDFPYLVSAPDAIPEDSDPFCSRAPMRVLRQVLNDYDLETLDYYQWKVEYSQKELSDIVRSRSGEDFGEILDLEPLDRGPSGRIWRMNIKGTLRSETVQKELRIRRLLSTSHLKSSAFTVERTPDGGFVLRGRGWGHGVGLCQIGAAVMADEGYNFEQILSHYYKGSKIENI